MTPATTILIVQEESPTREMFAVHLRRAGFLVAAAGSAPEAAATLRSALPDVLILQRSMSENGALALAAELRKNPATANTPILLLAEKDGGGLPAEHGKDIDELVHVPCPPAEIANRVRGLLLRKAPHLAGAPLRYGELELDPTQHRVRFKGKTVNMGPTEFRLLFFFMSNPEVVHSRSRLLDNVWGDDISVDPRTVDVNIRRLRTVLIPLGQDEKLQTVRGVGYRFAAN